MQIYPKRLLKGILYLGVSLSVTFHEFGTNSLGADVRWRDSIEKWAETQSGFVSGLMSFLVFVVICASVVYLAKGFFFLTTAHIEKVPALEVPLKEMFSKPCSDSNSTVTSNIEKMKAYRDAKFSTMMNEEMSSDYRKTAWIDGLDSNNTKNAMKAKEYINSKLSVMDNETSYKWLKGEK